MNYFLSLSLILAACASPAAPPEPSIRPDAEEGGATIVGYVMDAEGRPIEQATLHPGIYNLSRSEPSDARGRFEIWIGGDYPAGAEVDISVSAAGFLRETKVVQIGTGEVEFVLSRGAHVWGTLVAMAGAKLPEPLVVRVQSGSHEQIVTAHAGAFDVTGLPRGEDQRLTIRTENFVPHVLRGLNLNAEPALELGQLQLDPGGTLELSARDAFGGAVSGAWVEVRAESPSHLSWTKNTGPDGIARIRGLPMGVVAQVTTGPPEGFGRSLSVEHVILAATVQSDWTRADVILQRPVALRGSIVWDGEGPAPWLSEERLTITAQGTPTGADTLRTAPWKNEGAVPGQGVPLGQLDSVDFVLWAPPGEWNIDLSTSIPMLDALLVARLANVTIPVPAEGERSGQLDLGPVRFHSR